MVAGGSEPSECWVYASYHNFALDETARETLMAYYAISTFADKTQTPRLTFLCLRTVNRHDNTLGRYEQLLIVMMRYGRNCIRYATRSGLGRTGEHAQCAYKSKFRDHCWIYAA